MSTCTSRASSEPGGKLETDALSPTTSNGRSAQLFKRTRMVSLRPLAPGCGRGCVTTRTSTLGRRRRWLACSENEGRDAWGSALAFACAPPPERADRSASGKLGCCSQGGSGGIFASETIDEFSSSSNDEKRGPFEMLNRFERRPTIDDRWLEGVPPMLGPRARLNSWVKRRSEGGIEGGAPNQSRYRVSRVFVFQ